MKTGIYVHIPFCIRKCNYCAFLSFSSSMWEREEYVEALVREIELRAAVCREAGPKTESEIQGIHNGSAFDIRSRVYDSVYFGGGTPSVLSPEQLGRVIDALRENYCIAEGAEITLEVNPGTLGGSETEVLERLRKYRELGINRLSMGVQSMNDERLKFLGRIHDSETVERDFRLARQAGFDNINLDIIFSVPGETLEDALTDIRGIASLGPEHISFYSLQLEEDTPFFRMWENREFDEVDDETDRHTYHRGCELLAELGYEHYEISNFAKTAGVENQGEDYIPDENTIEKRLMFGRPASAVQIETLRSRHNSKYWSMTDYLAFGLGASGMITLSEKSAAPSTGVKPEFNTRSDSAQCTNDDVNAHITRRYRYRNISDFKLYCEYINNGKLPVDELTENNEHDNISETVFTGLRRREGVRYDECFADVGCRDTESDYGHEGTESEMNNSYAEKLFWKYYAEVRNEAESFARSGHLIIDSNGLRLTEAGIDISNRIMSLFV